MINMKRLYMTDRRTNLTLSIVILLVFLILWFVTAYATMPFGDDLATFENAISIYLDDMPDERGANIVTFSQVLRETAFIYRVWSGRVSAYIPFLMNGLVSEPVKSLTTALLFGAISILVGRLIYGSAKETMQHPLALAILCAMLFWFNNNMCYMYMWTMTTVYGFSTLFYFGYYNMTMDLEAGRYSCSKRRLLLMNLLGIVAGLSNELLGAIFILMIAYKLLRGIVKRDYTWKKIFCHSGLAVGYCFCFFAPGNFNRLMQSHESGIRAFSFFSRMLSAVKNHLIVLVSKNPIAVLLLLSLLVIFAVSFCIQCKKKSLLPAVSDVWERSAPYIIGYGASILLWAVMSYCPVYALTYTKAFFLIVVLSNIEAVDAKLSVPVKRCLLTAFMVLFLATNVPWVCTYLETTQQRRMLIEQAVERDQSEVVLPAYPTSIPEASAMLCYLNQDMFRDTELQTFYYGITIRIE